MTRKWMSPDWTSHQRQLSFHFPQGSLGEAPTIQVQRDCTIWGSAPTYPVAALNGSQFWPGERSVLCSNEGLWVGSWVGAGYQIRNLEFSHSPFCREGRRAGNGVDAGSCLGEDASIKSPMYGSGELLGWWAHGGSGLMAPGEGMNALLLPTHLVLCISSIRVFIGLLYHIAL